MALRRVTLTNGTYLFLNPDHVMFVAAAQKDGVPMLNESAVRLIDAMIAVKGSPSEVALTLSGE